MIVKGGARSAGGFFAKHLMKAEDNERVSITEMKGLYAEDLPEAFRELKALAAGSRGKDYFYHASLNPREDERLTPEQWDFAVDRLEHNLGLDGHARFQIEHVKEGREHRHIVWSRVNPETLTLANHWRNYEAHDKTRAELEQAFNHQPTPPTPQERRQRKSREIADWENFRAAETGIDPKAVKAEVTNLWQRSDSGAAFVAALEESGYTLCQGDRGYCIIDEAGDVHSLTRRIDGVKTAQIRERLDIPLAELPTVAEASAAVKARSEAEEGDSTAGAAQPPQQEPRTWVNPKFALLYKYAHDHPALAPPEPGGYISPATAQEFAAHQKAMLPFDNQAAQEQQYAWHTLETRRAELSTPQAEVVKDAHDELWEEWMTRHREPEKEPER